MIELAHAATGALAGDRCDGPLEALLAGISMHALGDIIPHGEVNHARFEELTAVGSVLVLAGRFGLRSPVVWGAVGGVLPDLEHILPRRIRSERGWFPTHRYSWLHSNGPLAIPAWLQVLAGGAIIGVLVARVRRRAPVRVD